MKRKLLLFVSIILISTTLISCEENTSNYVTIKGTVRDNTERNVLPEVGLDIKSPELLRDYTITDISGVYTFDKIEIDAATDITIRASLTGYVAQEQTITAIPDQSIILDFDLVPNDFDDNPDDGGGNAVIGDPGEASAIVLTSLTESAINIRQTGGIVNAAFTFEVQDSAGRALNEEAPVNVHFAIIKGPNGGEGIVPALVETNDKGQATANLFSGDSAGVVRIEAFVIRDDGVKIASSPVLVSINGGFPAPDRFFVAPINYNLEGFGLINPGLLYSITASVGDRYGNPVKTGTSVDFRSSAGKIDGSAETDERGFATVYLSPDGSSPTNSPLGTGFFTITAKTVDENNNYVSQDIDLLFTTREAIITYDSPSFDIPSNGSDVISFSVTDLNGYPMAAGTQIKAEAAAGLEVVGDVGFNLGDYWATGDGKTHFTMTVSDVDSENNDTVSTSVTVTVTTPSGYVTQKTISGSRAKIR